MTWKGVVSVVAAFAFGAIFVYAILAPRHPEEWGVVVVHFGSGGASLWGLFESKADCLEARTAFIEEYGRIAKAAGAVKKGSRALVLEQKGPSGASVLVTFSCLPLGEIRGLSLSDDSRISN